MWRFRIEAPHVQYNIQLIVIQLQWIEHIFCDGQRNEPLLHFVSFRCCGKAYANFCQRICIVREGVCILFRLHSVRHRWLHFIYLLIDECRCPTERARSETFSIEFQSNLWLESTSKLASNTQLWASLYKKIKFWSNSIQILIIFQSNFNQILIKFKSNFKLKLKSCIK